MSGTVTFNGKPLTSGTVQFNPADAKTGRMGQAKIAEDGTFIPSTFKERDGLLPGTYSVTVSSTQPGTEVMAKDKGTGIGGKSAIPVKYNDPKTSGLNETVGAGDANKVIALELKD